MENSIEPDIEPTLVENREQLVNDVQVYEQSDDDIDEEAPTADEQLRYFGADFDVDGIIRRLDRGDFTVPSFDPDATDDSGYQGFQRKLVWSKRQKDRFVETLLLGYPVPGIFLVERPNKKYLVLDGQQRLRTLQSFRKGEYGEPGQEKPFRLEYVGKQFHGKRYSELTAADQRLLDNTFIQATIIVPQGTKGRRGVYELFARINSGGTNLQPQEIRVALYPGQRIQLIKTLNHDENWRHLFGKVHTRLKDNELILRYMALREVAVNLHAHNWDADALRDKSGRDPVLSGVLAYRAPMSNFLNTYLEMFGETGSDNSAEVIGFHKACEALAFLGDQALRTSGSRQVNAAHTDAVLVGLSIAIENIDESKFTEGSVRAALNRLFENTLYMRAISDSTSHASQVIERIRISTQEFMSI